MLTCTARTFHSRRERVRSRQNQVGVRLKPANIMQKIDSIPKRTVFTLTWEFWERGTVDIEASSEDEAREVFEEEGEALKKDGQLCESDDGMRIVGIEPDDTDYGMPVEEFCERVGMLMDDDLDVLATNGFKEGDFESNGMFDTDKLGALLQFCETHPEYHIVTLVDYDDHSIYLNEIAYVNRMGYYLANGDEDDSLFCDLYNPRLWGK